MARWRQRIKHATKCQSNHLLKLCHWKTQSQDTVYLNSLTMTYFKKYLSVLCIARDLTVAHVCCETQLSQHIQPQSAGWPAQLNRLWISMPAVMVKDAGSGHSTYCDADFAASFINFLHYSLPSSGFYGAGKDNRGRHTDNPSGHYPIQTIGAFKSITPHFYIKSPFCASLTIYPGLGQAPNNAGLHTWWQTAHKKTT